MSTTETRPVGVLVDAVDVTKPPHPHWSDGTPILIGDHVEHRTHKWFGVVDGVPNSDEVLVTWVTDEDDWSDPEENAPNELVRVMRWTGETP